MKRIILHVLDINSPRDVVNGALTSIKGLGNWWTTDVSGSAAEGGIIAFNFAGVFKPEMKVIISGGNLVEWKCTGGEKEWAGDKFTFALEDAGPRVKLTFTQEYSNDITDEQYGRFNFNWGYYLSSLKQYCETGKGMPFTAKK